MDRLKKIFNYLINSVIFVLFYTLLYQLIQETIAMLVISVIANTLSIMFCISLTQIAQVLIKQFVKTFTKKEGDEKMKIIKKACYVLWNNKFTILMTLISALAGYAMYFILPIPMYFSIPLAVLVLALGILSSIKIGLETYEKISKRKAEEKESKKDKIEKVKSKKEIKRQKKEDFKNKKEAKSKNKLVDKDKKVIKTKLENEKLVELKKAFDEYSKTIDSNIENEYQKFIIKKAKLAEELRLKKEEEGKVKLKLKEDKKRIKAQKKVEALNKLLEKNQATQIEKNIPIPKLEIPKVDGVIIPEIKEENK